VSVVANVAINIDAKNAQAVLDAIQAKVKDLNGSFDQVKAKSAGAGGGLGGAFSKALGPLLAVVAAAKSLQEVTAASFDRAGAEQRIKALSSAYGEQTQVLALATNASRKFGITQTEASTAIADVYGRLRPLGLGLSEINSVYEGFNVVARQSGLSAAESSSVFTQLAQALGSGVLRGDEFNRMAESMPGILGLVAEQLGVSQGALRGMAADGKITGEVVVKALQQAQQSAGDLAKYMTPAQIAMQDLARNSQEAMVQLGNFAAPAVTAGMSALGTLAKAAADTFKYLNDVALPKLIAAFSPLAAALKPIIDKLNVAMLAKVWSGELVTAINLTTAALNLLAKPAAFVIEKFIQLSSALAAIDQRVTLLKLLAGYFTQASAEVDKYIAKQDAATQKAVDLANASHGMPNDIAAAAEKTAQLTASLTAAKDQALAGKLAIEGQVAALERGNTINQARYGAEQALNTLKGAQLEREMSLATTAQQRADIAVKMFQQQVQAAQIEYQMAMEAIKLDQQKQQLAIGALKVKYEEIAAEGKLQALKDPKNEDKIITKMNEALASQKAAIDLAGQNLGATQQTALYQEQTAKAVLATKIVQAQLALEGKLTSDNIGMSQRNAVSLSNSLAAGVGQAQALSGAMGQVAANAANAAQQLRNVQAASAARAPAPAPTKYASGGFVSGATNAIIGEAGPEYVVPASKAASFASNYLSGMRGNTAVQSKTASSAASYLASPNSSSGGGIKAPAISIQTGPVMQMGGASYVTTQDMARAVQSGVRQTLNMLRNDGSARRVAGMA
jgi:tape measure domain-containing protein